MGKEKRKKVEGAAGLAGLYSVVSQCQAARGAKATGPSRVSCGARGMAESGNPSLHFARPLIVPFNLPRSRLCGAVSG